MRVYLIGVGMGNPATLTLEAKAAIEESKVLIGAPRLLEPYQGRDCRALIAADDVAQALQREGPPGLKLLELSCGETQFNREMGLFQRPVEASCQGYLYAVAQEGGTFLDFIVRGETKL